MKGYWSGLPTWAKGVVAVVGVVAVGGIGFAIYRGVKKAIETAKEGKGDREIKSETKQELQQLENQGIQPTLSDSQAISLANFIFNKLDGAELSGSEKAVVEAILSQVQNQADWLKLQNTFGVRTIDVELWGTGDRQQDLKDLLGSDLDGWDSQNPFVTDPNKKYINILKNGLQAKGINW